MTRTSEIEQEPLYQMILTGDVDAIKTQSRWLVNCTYRWYYRNANRLTAAMQGHLEYIYNSCKESY